ncbi:diguanylate cyclase (GGDEF) domain-containing protein [Duganella sp. CF458]|uniref:diguanylate cyclase domain-containing protein n=1 Tax=Duganella sp. CF458 TaxID=1884368 RepID=UPI0008EF465D|nr:diguanylate cyclase [Duganella sp. CF458]SFG68876.1 diguanylate cyclase (GGDEF) domain-containing protein [Duganella sp. CF458]
MENLALSSMHEAPERRVADYASACQHPAAGLASRSLFNDRLRAAMMAAGRSGRNVAVLALTMDCYRGVKSSLGHEACSALLMHAALAIKSCLRECDTVAHLLCNEFAVILPDMANEDDVMPLASKLLQAIKQPMYWQDSPLTTTASIGIALMGQGGSEAAGMLHSANSAMAQAQGHGGNRFRFVVHEMNDRASRMFAQEAELRRALLHSELLLHYQLRAGAAEEGPVGAEARVLWQHPKRGLVALADFVQVAESSGLIVPLGAWAIREVCRQQRAWREAGGPILPVSITLSPRQLGEDGFVEHIEVAMEEYGVAPAMLSFEITDSIGEDFLGEVVSMQNELKAIGIQLSFGPGSCPSIIDLPMAADALAQLLAADRPRSNTMLPLWKAINYKA